MSECRPGLSIVSLKLRTIFLNELKLFSFGDMNCCIWFEPRSTKTVFLEFLERVFWLNNKAFLISKVNTMLNLLAIIIILVLIIITINCAHLCKLQSLYRIFIYSLSYLGTELLFILSWYKYQFCLTLKGESKKLTKWNFLFMISHSISSNFEKFFSLPINFICVFLWKIYLGRIFQHSVKISPEIIAWKGLI